VDFVFKVGGIACHELHRTDVGFTLMGSEDCRQKLVKMQDELGLTGCAGFTSRVPDETVVAWLSTADVGLSPAPKTR